MITSLPACSRLRIKPIKAEVICQTFHIAWRRRFNESLPFLRSEFPTHQTAEAIADAS